MSLLDSIKHENDIKKIDPDQLPVLAQEVREFLLANVSKTGGHLASNLGAVELTIALHRVMDFPEDKLIFDVGHQSYTHKILTGRKDRFYSLRQFGGMSGFPKSSESDADAFNTGHSSTSLSAALGYAEARKIKGTREKICAVIGDGSLTGGMVYEALDQMSHLKQNLVIILNDNEMSIGANVGGLSTSLSKFRLGKSYNRLKNGVENSLLKVPEVGFRVAKGIKKSKDAMRNLIVPDTIFDEMGVTYVGPIDGHDIDNLTEIINDAFKLDHPVLVHVKTKKGKGYRYAEKYPEHFHGVGPFDLATGKSLKKKTEATYTDVFAKTLITLAEQDERIVAITAAMASGTGLKLFEKKFPKRFFDVGIAEQHGVTFAAGLAKSGLVPVFAVYSSFLQRGYDQLLHDVCLQKLHAIFCIDRSGLVGEDGETHHGIYDTAYLRSIPGLTVLAPKGAKELEEAMKFAVSFDGPVAIKYSKGTAYQGLNDKTEPFVQGKSEVINFEKTIGTMEHKTFAILAVGEMVANAVAVRDQFAEKDNYTPELVNVRFIKPFDSARVKDIASKFDYLVVIEESIQRGSVGEEVGYTLAQTGGARLLHICIQDEVVTHGSVAKLRESLGLDVESIYKKIHKVMFEKG